MPAERESGGDKGDDPCTCAKCQCDTVEQCEDPRSLCPCNGECCNPISPDPNDGSEFVVYQHEEERELVPV